MGQCVFCNSRVWFGDEHGRCRKEYERWKDGASRRIAAVCLSNQSLTQVDGVVASGPLGQSLGPNLKADVLLAGWERAVADAADDHVLTPDERKALAAYLQQFNVRGMDWNRHRAHSRFLGMMLLSYVQGGLVPRFETDTRLPFNLMKSEAMLFPVGGCAYWKTNVRKEYRGGSMGMSIRVARGVYIRPGAHRGRTVSSEHFEPVDEGLLGLTTKHLYFKGQSSFRVRLDKIVSFEPFADGVGFMRDTARALPESFQMHEVEAYVIMNLIEAVSQYDNLALPNRDSPTLHELMVQEL